MPRRFAHVNVFIPEPIKPGSRHYARTYSKSAVPRRGDEIKVDKSTATQGDQRNRHGQVYRAMEAAHEAK
jgi:hypothetical protein